ncbi:TBC domain-containing protein kinase-like protein isoform X2 [Drosophila grimshawi]|uniref:GH12593 n=1 Tax=Drosophila grimshawi TaxID=7222 RepID=B4JK52_DROGR|nr:TBC domain-containing protein kinase-like protein isoform X2 [Drosophila grimshawi]EDV99954.1 GH12593 [Drosophila grimshawi]
MAAAGTTTAKLETRRLCAITFFAKLHPGDVCGSNGLPLTPNSIAILGRSQRLKELQHEHLCQYLDVVRGKHERTIVVSEYVGCTLEEHVKRHAHAPLSHTQIWSIFYQLASGLDVLHAHKLVVHNLEPRHILLDCRAGADGADGAVRVKLFNYGLHHMTKGGAYVPFPIGNVRYMAPERLLGANGNIKSDIWSWAMVMLELLLQTELWPRLKLSNIAWKLLAFTRNAGTSILEKIAREHQRLERYQQMPLDVRELLERCLSVRPAQRPLPAELLAHKSFAQLHSSQELLMATPAQAIPLLLRCPLAQIYHLWQLAGGDVQAELKKEGLIRSEAPILALPQIVRLSGESVCPPRSQSHLMDERVVLLKMQPLLQRLSRLPASVYFPLLHMPRQQLQHQRQQQHQQQQQQQQQQLPLLIRERDIEYQFRRVRLFTRLLHGYPHTADQLQREAAIDIPPLLRGPIWAALLGVLPNASYAKIDKFTTTTTDRQIEVDIPRCHQYDELLSSPDGHRKLKRLLKAWVTAHPQYVYWQGLDSLTAPFLYLNFNNEELAFLSLFRFIPKYLQWFFLKDNSAIIKEYLSKFSQLSAFHEPLLAQHLASINFIPELFAIPWFLTMFSHVFPLHKILHLWDKLMLGDSSYPLFIGIAILKQLKSTLLSSGFNECILLFSDLPDIVMESCVIESQKMYECTPKSITHRQHALRTQLPHVLDIGQADVELKHLQMEQCPRISAKDVHQLLMHAPDQLALIDLRSVVEYSRVYVPHSINIPFATVLLGEQRLEALNVPHLEQQLRQRIVVCVSNIHQHAVEFSHFLVACGVLRTCILHKGFNVLHSIEPNILISN